MFWEAADLRDLVKAVGRRAAPQHVGFLARRTLRPLRAPARPARASLLSSPALCPDPKALEVLSPYTPALAEEVRRLLSGEVPVLGRYVARSALPSLPLRERWDHSTHQHLVTLARARCLEFGDEVRSLLLGEVARFAAEWPPYRSPIWSNALINGQRLVSWCLIASLTGRISGDWDDLEPFLRDGIRAAADHVEANRSEYKAVPNCHLIGELAARLLAAATFSSCALSDDAIRRSVELLEASVREQVFPDGVSREQSLAYHGFVLEALLLADRAIAALGAKADLCGVMERMAFYLRDTRQPDGRSPSLGDDDGSRMFRLTSTSLIRDPAGVAALALGDAPGEEGVWLHGTQASAPGRTGGAAPGPRASEVLHWSSSGHVCAVEPGRDGGHFLFLRAGEFGLGGLGFSAHAHADLLSFVLFCCGRLWITEAGTGHYGLPRRMRRWFRSADAHNTVRPHRGSLGRTGGRFWWAAVPEGRVVSVSRSRVVAELSWRAWCWRRTFMFDWSAPRLEVLTELRRGVGPWVWFLHPTGPIALERDGPSGLVRSERGFIVESEGGRIELVACKHSEAYGRIAECVCVQGRVDSDRHLLRISGA